MKMNSLFRCAASAGLVLLGSLTVLRADPAAAPAGTPVEGFSDLSSWRAVQLQGSEAVATPGTDAPEGKPSVNVLVKKGGSGEHWAVQFTHALAADKAKKYHLTFIIKSEPNRYAYIGLYQSHAPYAKLAEGKQVIITSEWTPVSFDFTPTSDDADAHVGLTNLNQAGTQYWIANVALTAE